MAMRRPKQHYSGIAGGIAPMTRASGLPGASEYTAIKSNGSGSYGAKQSIVTSYLGTDRASHSMYNQLICYQIKGERASQAADDDSCSQSSTSSDEGKHDGIREEDEDEYQETEFMALGKGITENPFSNPKKLNLK